MYQKINMYKNLSDGMILNSPKLETLIYLPTLILVDKLWYIYTMKMNDL